MSGLRRLAGFALLLAGLAAGPTLAHAFDVASGPVLVGFAQQTVALTSEQLTRIKQLVAFAYEAKEQAQQQLALWRQAKALVEQPEAFLAESIEAWDARFGGLEQLSSAALAKGQALPGQLQQSWHGVLGNLRSAGEQRLAHVSEAVRQAIAFEHNNLTDQHNSAMAFLRQQHGRLSGHLAKLDQRILAEGASLATVLPSMAQSSAATATAVGYLSGTVQAISQRVDEAAAVANEGMLVGQDLEQRWHDTISEQLIDFRADPFGRRGSAPRRNDAATKPPQ